MNKNTRQLIAQSNEDPHLITVLRYGSRVDHATEMGGLTGKTTNALIVAGTKTIRSYDRNDVKGDDLIAQGQELGLDVALIPNTDTMTVEIQPTELLLINTPFEGNFRFAELTKHHGKVSRFILLPRTSEFALQAHSSVTLTNDVKPIGLSFGINAFIQEHDEWFIREHWVEDKGFTVLERR
jgi:hypothetical protein